MNCVGGPRAKGPDLIMKKVYRSIGSITLGWLIGSCGGGDSVVGPPPPTTATVTISSDTATLVPAASVQLSAVAKDASGQSLSRTFAWSTSDPAKATVSSSGSVVGVAPGTVTITAAVDGKSASSSVTVLDGGVLSASGGTLTLESGAVQIDVPSDALTSTTSLSVVASSAFASDPRVVKNTPFEFGPTGITFAKPVWIRIKYAPANLASGTEEAALEIYLNTTSGWQVVPGSKVDVDAKVVSAQVSHFSAYAILLPDAVAGIAIAGPPDKSMSPLVVGDSEQLTATLTAADGRILSNRVVTWSSSDATVASVSPTGLVTALKAGPATISASAGGKTSSVLITVGAVPVATVAVSPASASVVSGSTQQLTAVTKDAANNVLTGRALTWSSSDDAIATVDANGLVTSHAVGTATITAATEGKSGTSAIAVTAVPVAKVSVSLDATSLHPGQTTQASAITRDANGSVVSGRAITWSTDNAGVATVSTAGVVTAVSVGTASITATIEGKSGSAPLTVAATPVASVIVTPPTATVVAGATQQLLAETKDASGTVLSGRALSWQSDHPEIATVSTTGLVRAVAPGLATITASSEGKTGTSAITVSPVPVVSITVSLSATSITAVETAQATATTLDANGAVLTGRAVTWTSSNTAVATVSDQGLVTALTVGPAIITATGEGKTGTATIAVTPAPVASITLSPPSPSLVQGSTVQLVAETRDAKNRVLTGRDVSWSSGEPGVATVSASGLVTAMSSGVATIAAVSETKIATATVTVTPIPVATVTRVAGIPYDHCRSDDAKEQR